MNLNLKESFGTNLAIFSAIAMFGVGCGAPVDTDDGLNDAENVNEAVQAANGCGMGTFIAKLAIPNIEVSLVYKRMFESWIRKADPDGYLTKDLVQALLTGDAPQVQELLEQLLLTAMSFQDSAGRAPEKLYHGFVLGMLVHMEPLYDVRSNRESGRGRADVFMRPKTAGQPGVVMEFKVPLGKETPEQALVKAAEQVRNRKYATDLVAAGASPVYEYTMVFNGKQAWVKRV